MPNSIEIPTFVRWAGGKRSIILTLEKYFPPNIRRYHEPFLGGGSVFFYIKQKYNPDFCFISDINKDLINTYIAVRDTPNQLLKHISYFQKNNSEKFYYETREKYNLNKIRQIKRCAAFIYLNKSCYNGLYRVNSKNKFNVPFGHRKNIELINSDSLKLASALLQNVIIKTQSYEVCELNIHKGDFVYLDPCYDPLTKTSFTNYTPIKFSVEDRLKLEIFIRKITKNGAKVLLSNNDIPEIRNIYSDFKINKINALRRIGSNSSSRGKFRELLISN